MNSANEGSPLQKLSGKIPCIRNSPKMVRPEVISELAEFDRQIEEIQSKPEPTTIDLIQMISLTAKRESLNNQWFVIPNIVRLVLDANLSEGLAEGGSLRAAITDEVASVVEPVAKQLAYLQKEVQSLAKYKEEGARMPKKWDKILRNERSRCIEAADQGLVLFDQAPVAGETCQVNDEKLGDLVMAVAAGEEIIGWQRMAKGRDALQGWKGEKPPVISIRLRSRAARERIVAKARIKKRFIVRREIPELLLEEFRELNNLGAEIRKKERCQTYVGFAGSDIFLRKRKDVTQKWSTVKRL